MRMQQLGWKARWQVLLATVLVKLGKLTHDKFTEDELTALAAEFYPYDFAINTPAGQGNVTLQRGQVFFNQKDNRVCLQSLASIDIQALGSRLYRAHLVVVVSASPRYDKETATLHFEHVDVDDIRLINDDYSLIQDTRFLINKLVPGGLAGLFSSSVKNVLSLVSAGTSNQAVSYLQLYLDGSKQKILDYHRPQIAAKLIAMTKDMPLHHTMRDDVWREVLFRRYGERVVVANNALEFQF
ncbi:DUF1439 domain-containing protein [Alteromonas antoniana]|uniref:DUF1439 domain-containing protein n=1 Tax=Alteromonas antoniana TaxID=2803813 RepID=UPI001C47ACD4|nr:DUF1439 domain-containing protein [Alteromonas antoniana]